MLQLQKQALFLLLKQKHNWFYLPSSHYIPYSQMCVFSECHQAVRNRAGTSLSQLFCQTATETYSSRRNLAVLWAGERVLSRLLIPTCKGVNTDGAELVCTVRGHRSILASQGKESQVGHKPLVLTKSECTSLGDCLTFCIS